MSAATWWTVENPVSAQLSGGNSSFFNNGITTTLVVDPDWYTFGLEFQAMNATTLLQIRWYSPAGATELPTVIALFTVAGTSLVHSEVPVWSGTAGSGWVTANFTSPPAVAANTFYKACVAKDAGSGTANWYGIISHYFDTTGGGSGGLSVPPLWAPNNAQSDVGQMSFHHSNSLVYPDTAFNASYYGLDITVSGSMPQFPNGTNVGYENYPGFTGTLIDGSAITVQSNQTYIGYLNLGGGAIGTSGSPVHNVTFIGCCWTNSGISAFNTLIFSDTGNITFDYCTFQPAPFASFPPSTKELPVPQLSGTQYGTCADGTQASPGTFNTYCDGPLMIRRCDFWGFGNASARLANGSTAALPYTVQYNYAHNLRLNTDTTDHNDGIGAPGGGAIDGLRLLSNSINAAGDTNAVIWGAASSAITNCCITGNLFGGFGFTISLFNNASQMSNLKFTNNTFSTQIRCFFGPLFDQTLLSSTGLTWKGNKWLVPFGAYWGHQIYTGYFWLPGFTSNASPTLDELAAGLVGTTDFM